MTHLLSLAKELLKWIQIQNGKTTRLLVQQISQKTVAPPKSGHLRKY